MAAEHTHDDNFELLDLDAVVLGTYWTDALDWVADALTGDAGARVVDLGAGTGTAALGLARRLPGAEVIAVDVSGDALHRLRAKAAESGLGQRIRTIEADLDSGWPDLGTLDLVWASMSLHHLTDPEQALGEVLTASRPGGRIAVAEFAEPLRFLADDFSAARPGFEQRVLAALSHAHAETMPTLGTAWAPRLARAGWQVIAERDFTIDLHPEADDIDAAKYAAGWFGRLSHGLTDRLDAPDQRILDVVISGDEPGPAKLHIRGTRTITMAERP